MKFLWNRSLTWCELWHRAYPGEGGSDLVKIGVEKMAEVSDLVKILSQSLPGRDTLHDNLNSSTRKRATTVQPDSIDARLNALSNGLGCTSVGVVVVEEIELQDRHSRWWAGPP